jgi:tetratricopeptide (TPR) repeat protein
MSKTKEDPRQKAEAEAANASAALERGDWQAALTSLAHAVAFDPFRAEWTALVDRALDAGGAGAGEFLKKESHQPYLGFEGLKAHAAHRAGDYAAAFNALENLTRNFPNTVFAEAWGFGWITEDAVRAAGQGPLRFLASSVHNRYPEAEESNDWCRKHLARAIAALERIEAVLGASDQTVLFKGQMLSKAGRFEEAIAMAVKAAEANPTFRTATAAAMAHKRAGDVEGAVQWFWRASELDPKNETGLLDIGDTYVGMGEWEKALAAYEAALKRVPNHDWAHPSAVYCRYRLSGDLTPLEELRHMANAAPDECGMASIMKQMFGGYNFEDRRHRAEFLMREIEPGFVPTPRPHEHHDEEQEGDEQEGEAEE